MISLPTERSPTVRGLALDGLQVALFGGKGGVGKTTAAAAEALYFARCHPEQRVLLLSTDPAHSLADVIGQPIGAREVPVFDLPNAYACEFDAYGLFRDVQAESRPALQMILEGGTYLSREEVEQFLTLTMPGLDELMALFKIASLLQEGHYDLLILDNAPTGHMLRLLAAPSWLANLLQALRLMEAKRREIAGRVGQRQQQAMPEEFLNDWDGQLRIIRELLADPLRTGFYLLTLSDRLSLNETERLCHRLADSRLAVRALMVNRLLLAASCGACGSLARQQQQVLATMAQRLPGYPLFVCPWLDGEPVGVNALERWHTSLRPYNATASAPAVIAQELPTGNIVAGTARPRLPDFLALGRRLLVFGGKGGVGKTTLASATALHLARRYPARKILLASIDPAHSLADCLDHPVGPDPVALSPNLWAVEPDAELLFGEFHREFLQEIDAAWETLEAGQGASLAYDREIFEQLLALSPPGADEIMAIARITDFQRQEQFDMIVLDTPPTGHLVRFMELPELIGGWTHLLLRWLLHFQKVSELKKTINSLLKLSRSARDLHSQLTDQVGTELVVVTTAELPAVAETCRLVASLYRLGVACRYVVANMLLADGNCTICHSLHQQQQHAMSILESRLPGHVLVGASWCLQGVSAQAVLTSLEEVLHE